MMRKKISKGYRLVLKLAGSLSRYLDALSDVPVGKYVVLGLGVFFVFLRRLYNA